LCLCNHKLAEKMSGRKGRKKLGRIKIGVCPIAVR